MSTDDWDIKGPGSACAECAREFEDGEEFYTRLEFGPEGYIRSDYCQTCWRDEMKAGAVSTWRTVFHRPPPPQEPVRKETAEALLRRLIESGDESRRNVVFILAVMLERRRILVERDVQRRADGRVLRVYEHRRTGETFVILDPGLSLSEVGKVQEEVVSLLDGEGGSEEAG